MKKQKLIELKKQCYECKRCSLHENFVEGNDPHVFSCGNINSPVIFVGMNPARNEVKQKIPFVGKAGKTLDMLLEHIGLERKKIYISNVVRCFTIGLREPTRDERDVCLPFLQQEIQIIQPKLLVALGNFALEALTGSRGIMSVHGKIHDVKYKNIPVFATLHPSAINRKKIYKAYMKSDFEALKNIIGE